MDRFLDAQIVEGEVGLVVSYEPGKASATEVLQGAIDLVEALDELDRVLLSGIDSSLQPISILNDVQHSSIKLLLARAIEKIPDELIKNLDWKYWVGSLLVSGKYKLLRILKQRTQEKVSRVLEELRSDFRRIPGSLLEYQPPSVSDTFKALDKVNLASSKLPCGATLQTEFGDVEIPKSNHDELGQNTQEKLISESNVQLEVKIVSMSFSEGYRWRVSDGSSIFFAQISDSEFLRKVCKGEIPFLGGDRIFCEIQIKQYETEEGEIRLERNITKVLGHRHPAQQIRLIE